jgi:serine/threonine protein kinase
VRFVDFGMAHGLSAKDWAEKIMASVEAGKGATERQILPGKGSYRAPELHGDLQKIRDLKACDAFAVGVIFFAILVGEVPWLSTRSGEDKCFDCFASKGLRPFLYRLRTRQSGRVLDVLSQGAVELLEGLFEIDPSRRARLVDPNQDPQRSVWNYSWWRSFQEPGKAPGPGLGVGTLYGA